MSDSEYQRANELAQQVGRLRFFIDRLAALDQLRHELPADYLRDELHRLTEQARVYDLVDQPDVRAAVEWYRRDVEHWRYREQHGRRP